MSLILIEKRESAHGLMYYHFTDCKSKIERRWFPPQEYTKHDIQRGIELIGSLMDSHKMSHEDNLSEADAKLFSIPTPDMLLKDFITSVYMPRKELTISENTRACWQGIFQNHVIPALGYTRVCDIKAMQLSDYFIYLQKIGLRTSSINKHYTILQNVFKMLYMMDLVDESPLKKVERPKNAKGELIETTPASYSAKEIAYILTCMESEPFKYQVMIRVMCETGMRRGECCALTWDCIHFDTCTIDIVGNLCYTKDRGIYVDTPKNGKKNTVFVSRKTMDMLQELELLNFVSYESKYVFTRKGSGDSIHPHTPTKYFARFSKKYGIEHMHPHKLRHSFASIALTNGADAVSVAKLLGHSSVEVLFRYYVSTDLESAKQASLIFQSAITNAQNATE